MPLQILGMVEPKRSTKPYRWPAFNNIVLKSLSSVLTVPSGIYNWPVCPVILRQGGSLEPEMASLLRNQMANLEPKALILVGITGGV